MTDLLEREREQCNSSNSNNSACSGSGDSDDDVDDFENCDVGESVESDTDEVKMREVEHCLTTVPGTVKVMIRLMMMMMMKSATDEADEVKMREAMLNCSSRNSATH